MAMRVREHVLLEHQRPDLEELSDDLDLRSGDHRSKRSVHWTMLVPTGIVTAGVLSPIPRPRSSGAMITAALPHPSWVRSWRSGRA